MKNKNSTWTTIFWIVVIICVLQYVFMTVSRIMQTSNVTGTYILGSLIPNALIILVFWIIKRKSEK